MTIHKCKFKEVLWPLHLFCENKNKITFCQIYQDKFYTYYNPWLHSVICSRSPLNVVMSVTWSSRAALSKERSHSHLIARNLSLCIQFPISVSFSENNTSGISLWSDTKVPNACFTFQKWSQSSGLEKRTSQCTIHITCFLLAHTACLRDIMLFYIHHPFDPHLQTPLYCT